MRTVTELDRDLDNHPSAASPAEWSGGGGDDAVAAALDGLPQRDDGAAAPTTSPAVRVVHGRPDEIELAALVAGIVAARGRSDELGGVPDDDAPGIRSRWTDHRRRLGQPATPGAGSWRWSLHP
ncbi:hypothetical protein GCM10023169_14840 [Georgenia halophila]|uniref:Acyl-CoA carboxylase subunit epsilon n=1 Tax=Georgenia halophila TaxID=620889 RepID=A0ABP8L3Z4_9MICO